MPRPGGTTRARAAPGRNTSGAAAGRRSTERLLPGSSGWKSGISALGNQGTASQAWRLVVQDYVQQRTVNLHAAVVFNEPQIAEAVHEETDPRAGRPNHFRERFLADFGDYLFGFAFLAELRQQQENPGQPFFAGIEKLVNQILLNAGVACQKEADEYIGKRVLLVEYSHHFFLGDPEYGAFGNGGRSRLPDMLGCSDA
jgi:hypothetical protein